MPAGELARFSPALIHSVKRIGRDSLRLQSAAISLRTIFYLPLTWLSHPSQGCHLTTLPAHPQRWSFSNGNGENCAFCETDHTPHHAGAPRLRAGKAQGLLHPMAGLKEQIFRTQEFRTDTGYIPSGCKNKAPLSLQ